MRVDKIKKVAILGATGHIAKNLITGMCEEKDYQLYLIARSSAQLEEFISQNNLSHQVQMVSIENFNLCKYDIIINCIGIGDPGKLKDNPNAIFSITESFDNLILNYLFDSPDTLYINFSSGAAYLMDYARPANRLTSTEMCINQLTSADFYGISKINSEAKHRSLGFLNIVDLRIFGFFSQHIDINSRFFLAEVIQCIHSNKILITNSNNIIRDYVHPHDLVTLIGLIIEKNKINDVFDVYSLKPVAKYSILEYFSSQYGLQYQCSDETDHSSSITGNKPNYYSEHYHAKYLGYEPKFDSLTTIINEYELMKSNNKIEIVGKC